jgi:hypothetical protein
MKENLQALLDVFIIVLIAKYMLLYIHAWLPEYLMKS